MMVRSNTNCKKKLTATLQKTTGSESLAARGTCLKLKNLAMTQWIQVVTTYGQHCIGYDVIEIPRHVLGTFRDLN